MLFVSVLGVPSVHSVGTFFLQQIWNSTWEVVYRPFLPCHLLRFYEAAAFFLERYPQKTFVRDSECSNHGLLEVQYPPGFTWWPLKQKLPLMDQLCYAEVFSNCPSSEIQVVCIDFFVAGLGPGLRLGRFLSNIEIQATYSQRVGAVYFLSTKDTSRGRRI